MWRHLVKIGSRIKTGGSNQWPFWLPSQDSSNQSEASIPFTWSVWTNQSASSRHDGQWKAGFQLPSRVLPPTFSCVYRDWFRKHWLKENLKHFPLYTAPCKGWARLAGHDDLVLDCDHSSDHQTAQTGQIHDSWWSDRSYSWFLSLIYDLRTRQGYLIWLALHCLAAQKNVRLSIR